MASIPMQLYPQTMHDFIVLYACKRRSRRVAPAPQRRNTLTNFTADYAAIAAVMDVVLSAINMGQGAITLRDQQCA